MSEDANVVHLPPPPPPATGWTPEFCSYCGRRLVAVDEHGPFDVLTGKRERGRWLMCPRFPRSWRNLWMGGMGHDKFSATNPLLRAVWR